MNIQTAGQESEFYNYASATGMAELVNEVGSGGALKERLQTTLLEQAIPTELRAPLPARLHEAQRTGLENYLAVEQIETQKVEESRFPAAPRPNRRPADARPPALPSPAPPVSSGGAGGGAAAYRASGH